MRNLIILISLLCFSAAGTYAATQSSKAVRVPHHKSTHVTLAGKAKRVSLGDPEVLDIVMLKSNEVFLIGKKLGSTNLMAWDSRGRLIESINIEVTHDLNSLKAKLFEFLPDEEIKVHSAQNRLILSGQISNQAAMNIALRVAETYAAGEEADKQTISLSQQVEKTGVINLMTIGGAQQVMLEVTVAEVQRSLVRKFDANFHFLQQSGDFSWGGTSAGGSLPTTTTAVSPVFNSPTIENTGLLGSFIDSNTLFSFALDIAKQNGSAKVLAEPNLTALSGAKAEFLAGGEFPIPVPDDDGITIEYKEYGVGLKFIPTVLSDKKINLNLAIDVSEIANTSSLTLSPDLTNTTYVIPPITRRSASSTLELADGQTIGIAGLISENVRDIVGEMPGFSDIPILGQMFNSQEYISGETELVILVTPRLARPVDRNKVSLPTDSFVEPNDFEYYLLGRGAYIAPDSPHQTQQVKDESFIDHSKGGTEGTFGHSL
ncbi:type II and III secretion system protein family protein [Vibrio coralliilyticus]|jgi:pilus assembly protein CpaC|uniref:Type II and III secretion system protein family protein n=1 Tax=Vibrio coralliilyticus TaxID=190893 RepID=A0AAP6ZMB2_9VIBR|nr:MULTISPECIES: type II and III secretion system protein family protein [Vibrio]ERB66222.1 pilus assembly protein CpaC [Vibrio coralliilyticus OCN008]KFI09228.1 pilus assembly protein CpaC [Vibrio sp. B183]NOI20199.1 type II and III secretion system protein family protein [Vibrio coralliilyticus]NOJ24590.1 type II and III secretion system protein family protein [Vibrio coralliilyticus]NRF24518.1 type II and III secretion system protein family protein [Vibrio coralliilyticus]